MAAQRYISTTFWDDAWIQQLDPDEKLIYMYLLTNALTNIAGVYEITTRRIGFDTGYPLDRVSKALKRFEEDKKAYHFEGAWIILVNWPKHQKVTERSKIREGIDSILKSLPDGVWSYINAIDYQYDFLSEIDRNVYPLDTPSIPLAYPRNYIEYDSDTDTDIDTDTDTDTDINTPCAVSDELPSDEPKAKRGSMIPYKEIVDYLNQTCGTNFKYQSKSTKEHINARWAEGYRLDDFKTVISKKLLDSRTYRKDGTPIFDQRYLRPQTLFGTKFEAYLNQPDKTPTKNQADRINQMSDTMLILERMKNNENR